jgi:hypothetical protein
MTENTTPSAEPQDPKDMPVIWVSFCPDLGLYHLHREVDNEEPSDEKLTRDELEALVDGMVKAGQVQQIQQLIELCAWARLFAHKFFVLYTSGSFRVFNPTPPEKPEQEDSEFMKEFFASWKKDHPDESQLPTVVPFRKKG